MPGLRYNKAATNPTGGIRMDTKQRKYCDLIERVKASYPARNPSDDGKEPRLYWCDDCKEINLWTYWQGKGNLDAKIMLV